jgi:hypothetical protein
MEVFPVSENWEAAICCKTAISCTAMLLKAMLDPIRYRTLNKNIKYSFLDIQFHISVHKDCQKYHLLAL